MMRMKGGVQGVQAGCSDMCCSQQNLLPGSARLLVQGTAKLPLSEVF